MYRAAAAITYFYATADVQGEIYRIGTLWVFVYTASRVTLHNASGAPVTLAHH